MAENYNWLFGYCGAGNGNYNGIGDYFRLLADNNKKRIVYSIDQAGIVFEAQQRYQERDCLGFRMTSKNGENLDRLPVGSDGYYVGNPEEIAEHRHERIKFHWPVELDRTKVWSTYINEPSRELEDIEFLARFALKSAELCLRDGYRYCAWGWAGGTPERAFWEHPKTLQYLRLCEEHPEQLGVNLHLYSLNNSDLLYEYDFKVGRYKMLYDVCKKYNIKKPFIFAAETGWGEDAMLATTEDAIKELISVQQDMENNNFEGGCALWTMGTWHGTIVNDIQKIVPINTDIASKYIGKVKEEEDVGYKSVVIKIAQEHTENEWSAIARIAFKDYKRTLTASHDNAKVMVLDGNSESYVYIVDPSLPSQQAMIELCNQNGITWKPIYLRDVPTEPQPEYIDVVNLNQRDIRWGSQLCGYGPKTIAQWGCLLTVYTMLNDYFLNGQTPKNVSDENQYYKSKGGFSGDNLVSMAMSKVYTNVKDEGWLTRGTAMTAKTKNYIDRKIPVPARVDFKPETGQLEQHWVLLVGYDDNGWIMNDPWTGKKGVYVKDYYNVSGDDVLECIYYYYEETSPPKIDLLPYLKGNGVLYEVRNASGSQERFQTQSNGQEFLQTKNSLAEQLLYSNSYIYRGFDTSAGNNRFYVQQQNKGDSMARWLPRYMYVGENFTTSLWVQFYNWDCSESSLNSGQVTDTRKFVAHYNTWTSRAGITLNDVIELEWVNGGERYFYAKGYGLVGWERLHQDAHTPQWSAISEIHAAGQRPDNVVNLPSCL